MPKPSEDLIVIASPALTAQINVLGAELSALRLADGSELLWDGDPEFWTGRAPLLFPIVGALNQGRYRLGDATYEMAQHGFARRRPFTVVAQASDTATLRLEADEQTLPQYPFRFRLDATFTVTGRAVTLAVEISNLGDEPMPASFGWHPALRWPLPGKAARTDHYIRFAHAEPAPIRRLTGGLLEPEPITTPVRGNELKLEDSLFEADALIFDQIVSRRVIYGAPGGLQVEVTYDGLPYLGVWTKPGAGFVCIEPWHGIADPVGYDGDFTRKPGVFEVAPGASRRFGATLTALA